MLRLCNYKNMDKWKYTSNVTYIYIYVYVCKYRRMLLQLCICTRTLKLGQKDQWKINWKFIQTLLTGIDDLLFGVLTLHSMQQKSSRTLLYISMHKGCVEECCNAGALANRNVRYKMSNVNSEAGVFSTTFCTGTELLSNRLLAFNMFPAIRKFK